MLEELKDYIQTVENFDKLKASEQIDFLGHFFIDKKKQDFFTPTQIEKAFEILRILPYSNVSQYLNDNSNKAKTKKKKVKFIKTKEGFHFLSTYETELKSKVKEKETDFINFSVNQDSLDWKPSDIPFLNSKIKKNAEFFSKLYFLLYHLENSIRKFLNTRLSSILGTDWEKILIQTVDLTKATLIKKETNLSEMLQDRGDSILFYCMWDDYGKIIKQYPQIFSISKDCDEVLAHLNSLAKIRNAIAHNTATIPKDYQDELTLFIKKYIKIMKNNGS
ncbi:HEPN domain-containing protein [Flavobacterium sp. H122]|uniref:HEPN domain-containing protein n=1 Tax=Flavobacterium sp. H122 TaxID=2529860 RepID=UPI0010A9A02B|nr:HEPN domain-containing protein [Flavobacterium sp. H122]